MSDYPAGTILGAWPVTVGDLQLDRVDECGVEWSLTSVKGWGGASSSGETVDRPGADGAWAPAWTLKPKEYTLAGSVDAETPETRWAAEQRFVAAFDHADTLMVVDDEVPRQSVVRLNGVPDITRTSPFTFDFEASVLALDPRRYSVAEQTALISFPSRAGGMSWPARWPARWSAGGSSGAGEVRNDGNAIAWPVWEITGPVSQPSITNLATGEQSRFDVELGAGESLLVDTANRHVLANGDPYAPRRDKFRGDWWGLHQGITTVRFGGANGEPEATLAGTWRHTWK